VVKTDLLSQDGLARARRPGHDCYRPLRQAAVQEVVQIAYARLHACNLRRFRHDCKSLVAAASTSAAFASSACSAGVRISAASLPSTVRNSAKTNCAACSSSVPSLSLALSRSLYRTRTPSPMLTASRMQNLQETLWRPRSEIPYSVMSPRVPHERCHSRPKASPKASITCRGGKPSAIFD